MSLLAPANDFQTLVERMLDDLPFLPEFYPRVTVPTATPSMDVFEKDGHYKIEMAVPGYDAKDIHAEVNAGTVTISGTHVESTEKKDAKYFRKELRRGSFTRTLTLPQDIDANTVDAKVEKGILYLTLTPVKPIAAKKIAIKG